MLTLRTSAEIAGNRHRLSFRFSPASTGGPGTRGSTARLIEEWRRLLNAESRRGWLEMRWRSHLRRVRQRQG